MIRFSFDTVCGVQKSLDRALEEMLETRTRLARQAEDALKSAEQAISAAKEDQTRLRAELKAARDCAVKHQEMLFAAEDSLGRTLTQLEKAQQQYTAAEKALKHAERALQEAEAMPLPPQSNANFEMLETGKNNAIKNAKANFSAAQRRMEDAAEQMAEIEVKIADVKPCMDACRKNLAELASISAEIGKELEQIDCFLRTISQLRSEFTERSEELLDMMRIHTDQMEQPRKITVDAVNALTGFYDAMNRIQL